MSKLLKSDPVSLPEIKSQQWRNFDETCRVHMCQCKESTGCFTIVETKRQLL